MCRLPKFAFVTFFSIFLSGTLAAGYEVSQSELRQLVLTKQSVSLASIFDRVRSEVQADPVDARAFDLNGIYYCVMAIMPDGQLVSIIVEGKTGQFLAASSEKAREVRAFARYNRASPTRDRVEDNGYRSELERQQSANNLGYSGVKQN